MFWHLLLQLGHRPPRAVLHLEGNLLSNLTFRRCPCQGRGSFAHSASIICHYESRLVKLHSEITKAVRGICSSEFWESTVDTDNLIPAQSFASATAAEAAAAAADAATAAELALLGEGALVAAGAVGAATGLAVAGAGAALVDTAWAIDTGLNAASNMMGWGAATGGGNASWCDQKRYFE